MIFLLGYFINGSFWRVSINIPFLL